MRGLHLGSAGSLGCLREPGALAWPHAARLSTRGIPNRRPKRPSPGI